MSQPAVAVVFDSHHVVGCILFSTNQKVRFTFATKCPEGRLLGWFLKHVRGMTKHFRSVRILVVAGVLFASFAFLLSRGTQPHRPSTIIEVRQSQSINYVARPYPYFSPVEAAARQ